jgi:hypothetical protein
MIISNLLRAEIPQMDVVPKLEAERHQRLSPGRKKEISLEPLWQT